MNREHVEWCRRHFAMIRDGGAWAVPSLGLIFNKRGSDLVLVARLPHDPAMPITAEELVRQQEQMFQDTVENFGAAGIAVKSEV